MRDIHISIVSHNQFDLIQKLLLDIEQQDCNSRIYTTITINTPEATEINLDNFSFPITFIYNGTIKGFAANHNAAFSHYSTARERIYFLVINPDVRINESIFKHLIEVLEENRNIVLIAPKVYDTQGTLEDSARILPTPLRLIAKIFGKKGNWDNSTHNQPDWIAGMFMFFRADAFRAIEGFDERYFLYYEDVDICSRIWLKGYRLSIDKNTSIIHDARRDSRRNMKYLCWHLSSIYKFFTSDVYRKIKKFHKHRS